jgi:dTDP-4-amino-4,6-dideoxygalactose transaminase
LKTAAQAHGATRSGKRAGSFTSAAFFSFYPTKNLGGWSGMEVPSPPVILPSLTT